MKHQTISLVTSESLHRQARSVVSHLLYTHDRIRFISSQKGMRLKKAKEVHTSARGNRSIHGCAHGGPPIVACAICSCNIGFRWGSREDEARWTYDQGQGA